LEKTRKWRWGVNRWIVLLFILLSIVAVNMIYPVQPHIQVAPERIVEEPLFNLGPLGDFYLVNSLPSLLVVDLILIGLAFAVRQSLRKGDLVPHGISGAMEMVVEMLYNLTESSAGKWAKKIFPWFATILLVVLVANLMELLPGMETIGLLRQSDHGHAVETVAGMLTITNAEVHEGAGYTLVPFFRTLSTDLNFTLALALISVFMTQVIGVQAQGIRYFSKFLNFTTMFSKPAFGFMDFIVGILELISELAKILSFTFRLFGVMFSGFVLVALVGSMVPIFAPAMIYMFEAFMAVIQAFVFGMLTMVFMAMATQGHGSEEHH